MTDKANSSLLNFALAESQYSLSAGPGASGSGDLAMWGKARDQVSTISQMATNWDGDGASPIGSEIVQSAFRLLQDLKSKGYPPPDDVYPTPDAAITVEWQFVSDVIMRIEVDGLDRGEIMVSYPTAPSRFDRVTWSHPVGKATNPSKPGDWRVTVGKWSIWMEEIEMRLSEERRIVGQSKLSPSGDSGDDDGFQNRPLWMKIPQRAGRYASSAERGETTPGELSSGSDQFQLAA